MITHNESIHSEPVLTSGNDAIDGQVSKSRLERRVADARLPGCLNCMTSRVLRMVANVHEEARFGIGGVRTEGSRIQMLFSMGNAFKEDRVDVGMLVATGRQTIPKVLESVADVDRRGAEGEDAMDGAKDEPCQDTRRVGRTGWDVQVQI